MSVEWSIDHLREFANSPKPEAGEVVPAGVLQDLARWALDHCSGERCLECGGLDGAHGRVHTRYGNGGGGNRPCSRAQESGDPS